MLPDVRRLNREDFADAPDWIDPMLNTINTFMDSVYNILNKNVSLNQNLNAQFITLNITTKSDGSINEVKQKLFIRGRATGVIILRITGEDVPNISYQPFIDWSQSNNILTISNIATLSSNKEYKILFLVIGE